MWILLRNQEKSKPQCTENPRELGMELEGKAFHLAEQVPKYLTLTFQKLRQKNCHDFEASYATQ